MDPQAKVLPQALDVEQAVIGLLLTNEEAVEQTVNILTPEMFYVPFHQQLFKVISKLHKEGQPVDLLTVSREYLKQGGSRDNIHEISSMCSGSGYAINSHVESHAFILREKWMRRSVIYECTMMERAAYQDEEDIFEVGDKYIRNLSKVIDVSDLKPGDSLDKAKETLIHKMQEASKHQGIIGIPSGLLELDKLTLGWRKSMLYIVAARPGMGKSSLVKSTALNAIKRGDKGIIFSLEMSTDQFLLSMVSEILEIDNQKLTKGELDQHQWADVNRALAQIPDSLIQIDDTPALTIDQLKRKCKQYKRKMGGLDYIIIDYLQLMGVNKEDKKLPREQQVGNISKELKKFAKEFDIPVIALAQLSRDVEQRKPPRPILSDLRESGSIEQDADSVLFIYRPEYYGIVTDSMGNSIQGIADVMVAKNRHGSLGTAVVRFIGQYTKFEDLQPIEIQTSNPF